MQRSAELHVEHIATGGDPFELGSARPLDFGHWAAHKLEQISKFALSHGEAVAIGMAVDLVYSRMQGILDEQTCERVLRLIVEHGGTQGISHTQLLWKTRWLSVRERQEVVENLIATGQINEVRVATKGRSATRYVSRA